jgi:hypothetical protein
VPELDVLTRTILKHERDAARGADAGIAGGERRLRFHQPGEPLIETAHDDLGG